MAHVAGMEPSEVMVDPEVVKQVRGLAAQGWGSKRIARELGIARNTVNRYVRGVASAEIQVRPMARVLDNASRERAVELFGGTAEGNAVVVQRLLVDEGHEASVRSVQRVVASTRRARRSAQVGRPGSQR